MATRESPVVRWRLPGLGIVLTLFLPLRSLGQDLAEQWEFQPFVGLGVFVNGLDNVFRVNEGLGVGASVGFIGNSDVELEGTFVFLPTEILQEPVFALDTPGHFMAEDFPVTDVNIYFYHLNLTVNLGEGDQRVRPFITFGGGAITYDPEEFFPESGTDVMGNVGLGVRTRLSPRTALRVQLIDYISSFDAFEPTIRGGSFQNDLLFRAGVSLFIGG